MDAASRHTVRDRANRCCEYCGLPDAFDEWPFHVDHILARVHGGDDDLSNLCWSCTQCNLHKASNFASVDPESGNRVDLFNPRTDRWLDHFPFSPMAEFWGEPQAEGQPRDCLI